MLLDLDRTQVVDYIKGLGFPAFRGEQVYDAMLQGKTLQEVSNIPQNQLNIH